jgi:hypothetical protein
LYYDARIHERQVYNFSAVNILGGLFGVAEMDNLNCVKVNFMKWLTVCHQSAARELHTYIPSFGTDWLTTAECYDGVI